MKEGEPKPETSQGGFSEDRREFLKKTAAVVGALVLGSGAAKEGRAEDKQEAEGKQEQDPAAREKAEFIDMVEKVLRKTSPAFDEVDVADLGEGGVLVSLYGNGVYRDGKEIAISLGHVQIENEKLGIINREFSEAARKLKEMPDLLKRFCVKEGQEISSKEAEAVASGGQYFVLEADGKHYKVEIAKLAGFANYADMVGKRLIQRLVDVGTEFSSEEVTIQFIRDNLAEKIDDSTVRLKDGSYAKKVKMPAGKSGFCRVFANK